MVERTTPTNQPSPINALINELITATNRNHQLLRALLKYQVQTFDAQIYEHQTVQLDPAIQVATVTLPAQTAQWEIIESLYAAIVVPTAIAGPTITVDNAWAKLGSDYVNLNAILNSAAGTGGVLDGFKFQLKPESDRTLTIHSTAAWPSGAYLSFALFGTAMPASYSEVLH